MTSITKKRKNRLWARYRLEHAQYIENLQKRRKSIPLKALFLTLGLMALVSTVLAVKKTEYDIDFFRFQN